jgi:hydroxypyruvate reductase
VRPAIRDREALAGTAARETALACVEAGIEAADPERALRRAVSVDGDHLRICGTEYDLDGFEAVVVLGGGKAAARMARALGSVLDDRIAAGVVVTDDCGGIAEGEGAPGPVRVVEANHPVPDQRGIEGAETVLELADGLGEDALALVVLSGGGSALLPAPVDGIDLAALRAVTEAMLSAGLPIEAVNAVRKHCSRIKGGRLAAALAPATVHALAVSDVVGDDPAVIASGPTVGDPSTYADARAVLKRAGVDPPESVADHLAAGAAGDVPETPKPGDPAVAAAAYDVVADGRTALAAAREAAAERGYGTLVLSDRVRGEAREVAKTHAAVAESVLAGEGPLDAPAVVLSGGEVTVTVRGDGEGGPNAEFALSAAVEFADGPPLREGAPGDRIALASVDTDGRDGPGEGAVPAGAVVDGRTVADPDAARDALDASDARGYLDGGTALVFTGGTGTNVNDLRAVVIEKRPGNAAN